LGIRYEGEELLTKVKLLDDKATLPTRALESDTGYDIKVIGVEKIVGDVIFFKTGLSIQPPKGHYFEVVPRSSISKLPLELANSIGIIDEHYRGEILIPVRITHPDLGQERKNVSFPNGIVKIFGARPSTMSAVGAQVLSQKPVLFQMILRKRLDSNFKVVQDLDDTARGEGGFGSTG
jgi:dUTP pyrophosphatase